MSSRRHLSEDLEATPVAGPIVIGSAKVSHEQAAPSRQAGANRHVCKPCETLFTAVGEGSGLMSQSLLADPQEPLEAKGSDHSEVADRLERASRAIEGTFLDAGEVLSAAIGTTGELIASLDRLAEVLDPDMVGATAENLRRAATYLLAMPQNRDARRSGLEVLAELGKALGASISDMSRSFDYLRVFSTYVKVTAGGVRDNGQQFAAFAEEIAQSIRRGRDQLTDFDADLTGLGRELRTALQVESTVGGRFEDVLPDTPNAIVASAAAFVEQQQTISAATLAVAATAREIRAKVGGVLGALQIGDITRQRLEHVQAALLLSAGAGESLAPPQRAELDRIAALLCHALLMSARDDFNREVGMIGVNMTGLAEDATEILRLLDQAHGRSKGAERGFLDRLESHVGDALALVDEVEAAESAAARVGLSAADAALRLGARIDDIQGLQRDVQHMAMNTRLKCSRIGQDGRPLAVIALELREHAEQLGSTAARVSNVIRDLNVGATTLGEASGRQPECTGASAASASLRAAVERIRQAGRAVDADFASLTDLGSSVVSRLRHAAQGADFQDGVGVCLDEARALLVPEPTTASMDDPAATACAETFLASVAKSYTMAQERQVHGEVLAALGLAVSDPAPTEPAAQDLDDVLF